jgi:hypothetical protein
MFQTRFFSAVSTLILAAAAALALTLALQPARTVGKAGAEAMEIYHQSEWSRAAPALTGGAAVDSLGLSALGRAIYQASEREQVPATLAARAARLWLAIYKASEWESVVPVKLGLGAEGLALYYASERAGSPEAAVDGMSIYHASEQSRVATQGARMSAYQRSEWLGADR